MTPRILLPALAAASIAAPAAAKGNIVSVGQTITGLHLPWTTFRAGERVVVRADVHIPGVCAALGDPSGVMVMETSGAFVQSCASSSSDCAAALQDAFWADGTEVRFVHDGSGASFGVRLFSCGTALCGEGVVPPFAPSGTWSTVEIPWRGDGPFSLDALAGVPSLVVENPSEDLLAPELVSLALPGGVVASAAPGIVAVVNDDVSGVAELRVRLNPLNDGKPSDGQVLDAILRCTPGVAAGSAVCTGERPLLSKGWLNADGHDWSLEVATGSYYVRELTGTDRAGRALRWEPPELLLGSTASLSKYGVSVGPGAKGQSALLTVWHTESVAAPTDPQAVNADSERAASMDPEAPAFERAGKDVPGVPSPATATDSRQLLPRGAPEAEPGTAQTASAGCSQTDRDGAANELALAGFTAFALAAARRRLR